MVQQSSPGPTQDGQSESRKTHLPTTIHPTIHRYWGRGQTRPSGEPRTPFQPAEAAPRPAVPSTARPSRAHTLPVWSSTICPSSVTENGSDTPNVVAAWASRRQNTTGPPADSSTARTAPPSLRVRKGPPRPDDFGAFPPNDAPGSPSTSPEGAPLETDAPDPTECPRPLCPGERSFTVTGNTFVPGRRDRQ